jgi:hypothetical protein
LNKADSGSKHVSVALRTSLLDPPVAESERVLNPKGFAAEMLVPSSENDAAENGKSHRQVIGLVPDFPASEFAPGSCRNANGCWKSQYWLRFEEGPSLLLCRHRLTGGTLLDDREN